MIYSQVGAGDGSNATPSAPLRVMISSARVFVVFF